MPDVYVSVTDAPRAILENLMVALEKRAADPQLRAMLTTYLTDASLPEGSRVLEVGCDALAATGRVDAAIAAELKAEARRRIADGEYYGHIAYVSLVARRAR